MALKSLLKAFFQNFIRDARAKADRQLCFMYVCINCLNKSLVIAKRRMRGETASTTREIELERENANPFRVKMVFEWANKRAEILKSILKRNRVTEMVKYFKFFGKLPGVFLDLSLSNVLGSNIL